MAVALCSLFVAYRLTKSRRSVFIFFWIVIGIYFLTIHETLFELWWGSYLIVTHGNIQQLMFSDAIVITKYGIDIIFTLFGSYALRKYFSFNWKACVPYVTYMIFWIATGFHQSYIEINGIFPYQNVLYVQIEEITYSCLLSIMMAFQYKPKSKVKSNEQIPK